MKVLIGCEFSGVVRRAFRALGHDAWSCDLLCAEDETSWHIIGDVESVLDAGWDLGIFHPPCTYLCNSGVRWLKNNPARQIKRLKAVEFVKRLWAAPIPMVAIENPVGCLSTLWIKPQQTIHPWMFGHPETKTTHLWLRGLPLLLPTEVVSGRTPRVHWMAPGQNRWKERSRTYEGVAKAMADQWGKP